MPGSDVNAEVVSAAQHTTRHSLHQELLWLYIESLTVCVNECVIAGEEVGFYFGWMCFYLKFICFPLIIGLVMYLLSLRGVTVDTDPYLPFFSVIMALWGVLFTVVRINHTFCVYSWAL